MTQRPSPERLEEIRERKQKRGRAYVKRHQKKLNKYTKEWRLKNVEKRDAHQAVQTVLRNGTLEKKIKCETCDCELKLHAHHDDYSKPLIVRWLCSRCHRTEHGIPQTKKTVYRGSKNNGSKLTESDIPVIRTKLSEGKSYAQIARDFLVSPALISQIANGLRWTHV